MCNQGCGMRRRTFWAYCQLSDYGQIRSNANGGGGGIRAGRDAQNSVAGHFLHYGLNAPPPAAQASVPGVASEDKTCFNAGSVGERTAPQSYST